MAVTPSQFPVINQADLDGTETLWAQKGGIDYILDLNNIKQFGGCDVYCTSLVITTAQVLALNSTPLTIVAAPGAGYAIEVISASVKITFNTTPYATSTSIALVDLTAGTYQLTSTGFLAATGTIHSKLIPTDGINAGNIIENGALKVYVPTADPTAGDSDIKIFVQYRIITL